jgi:hypothetical protein
MAADTERTFSQRRRKVVYRQEEIDNYKEPQ